MSYIQKLKGIKILRDDKKQRKKQMVVIISALCLTLIFAVCYCLFGKKMLLFFKDTQKFKSWLDSFGAVGKIVFVLIRALQTVVKFIPAEPLEIGSGFTYGVFGGLFYCMLGTFIGSVAIIILTKFFGMKVVRLIVSDEKIKELDFLKNETKLTATLFIIYLIPGTPKDVITYIMGITDYNMLKFLIITSIARIPSIITSTVCGATLEKQRYTLSAAVFILTAVGGIIGIAIYNKFQKGYKNKEK